MPRIQRVDVGGEVYHVLNRANARIQIFDEKQDYQTFETILEEAIDKYETPILAYCVMPNHWHILLQTKIDGDLQKFIGWISNTHTRRWHVSKESVGQGHLYQGRYKSFVCEKDNHLFTLLRYVERNPKTANLVKRAEEWQWSSLWRREYGSLKQKKILDKWPFDIPKDYLSIVDQAISNKELERIEKCEEKSIPFGKDPWVDRTVKKYNIEQVLRSTGRPKNGD